jgi:hypothetical protein
MERRYESATILTLLVDIQVRVLRRVWKPEQNRSRLTKKQISHPMFGKNTLDFLSLTIFERRHLTPLLSGSQATQADSHCTSADTPPSCRMIDNGRRPALAYKSERKA